MLRWASELATSDEPAKSELGVTALIALAGADLLQPEDQHLVDAVIDLVLQNPVEVIEQADGDVEVVEVDTKER